MTDVSAASAPPPPPPASTAQPGFDFGKPFTYLFDDPNWVPKILIGGLFYLAGFLIVGWFFILGYAARTARNIIRGDAFPLPEWDDLGAFFAEGLRLFGVALVYILPIFALATIFIVPTAILGAAENEGIQALGSGLAGCMACLMVPLSLAMMVFMPASLLFAAVEQRFGAAFEFGRIWTFIKENPGNYLLAIAVYLVARFLASFGFVLLCIGVIFTGFWSVLITTHGLSQAYRLAPRRP